MIGWASRPIKVPGLSSFHLLYPSIYWDILGGKDETCRSVWYFPLVLFLYPSVFPLSLPKLAILHSLFLPADRCSHPLPITVRLYTSQRSSLGAHLNKPIDLSFRSLSDGSILLSLHFSPPPPHLLFIHNVSLPSCLAVTL